ncbi:MAG: UDP-N-acetylmuramate dehydrogenase [Oscillospiraceae bacterium]|nr:UDP-N-acetylmuramate dehydrogenase [Oscillospiraceae bacterium]
MIHPEAFMNWTTDFIHEIGSRAPALPLLQGQRLSALTSFRIGGEAALVALPQNARELDALLRAAQQKEVRVVMLGAGTNVLAPDAGLDALVISTRERMTEISVQPGHCLQALCGVSLAALAARAQELGLTGLEFAHGIPGTVGGALMMNAGAYGGEIADVAVCAKVRMPDGMIRTLSRDEMEFSYRRSVFQTLGGVILEATFALRPGDSAEILRTMQQLRAKRIASQPLEYPSAGSTFKRPESGYAAQMIERAGLKGAAIGGAQVSPKHAGFIINRGGATAADVRALMALVQMRVESTCGCRLEPEVLFL